MTLTRRELLYYASSLAVLPALGCRVNTVPKFTRDPFTLGIASGDPLSDSVVLWTRLALDPLADGGGMRPEAVPVRWEIAKDESMREIVKHGTVTARPESAHAVHVDVRGLEPARTYFYRFMSGDAQTPVGRTRTAPRAHVSPERLRFAFASCQRWEDGYFTAYDHMVREDLDFVIHLGDYIYEYGTPNKPGIRPLVDHEITTVDDYRRRYALYRTDPSLRAAHQHFPFIITWDDHEVDNDYASDRPEDTQTREAFLKRRAAAYRAYYEHMPLRAAARPEGSDMVLYREVPFGALASFLVLDTRQFRTDQPCEKTRAPLCAAALDPAATITGAAQERWMLNRLDRSPARWNVLAQQVLMADVDLAEGDAREFSMDKWAGYQANSRRVHSFLATRKPSNPIVLTGDIHSNWVCDLKADYNNPQSAIVGTEFVGSSISTGGDGIDTPERARWVLRENPHVHLLNSQRGYVSCTVTADRWQSDYRIVPFVTRPDAPITTRASFVVENGRPGAQRA